MIEVYATRVRSVARLLTSEENVSAGEPALPVASETELVASSILFFGGGQGTPPSKTSKFCVFFSEVLLLF